MKKKNTFPPLKPKTTNGPAKQYNTIREFITNKKFQVLPRHFAEYSELITLGTKEAWLLGSSHIFNVGKLMKKASRYRFFGFKYLVLLEHFGGKNESCILVFRISH